MPKLQFKLRTLMIVITVVSLVCALLVVRRNRIRNLQEHASRHIRAAELAEDQFAREVVKCVRLNVARPNARMVWLRASVDYRRAMHKKYILAVDKPWQAVEPDPPPPKFK